jgi:hypothetical protein
VPFRVVFAAERLASAWPVLVVSGICKGFIVEKQLILFSPKETVSTPQELRPEEVGGPALVECMKRIEAKLDLLIQQRTVKEWYTTAEVAKIMERGEYTVREWCRQGRVRAKKKPCGRGNGGEWLISHEELTRLQNEGLLPSPQQQ